MLIRVPQQYVKTRVLSEGIVEETIYLLAEWLASPPVHGSIGFPEVVVPIVVLLRKSLKGHAMGQTNGKAKNVGAGGKEHGLLKVFLERVEESAKWMEERRKNVQFSPSKLGDVQDWERGIKGKIEAESPLGKYLKVQRKTREKRRQLVEKVCL